MYVGLFGGTVFNREVPHIFYEYKQKVKILYF